MRILHIHNVAGVSTTLAKFQNKAGDRARVIVRERHPFQYPGEQCFGNIKAATAHVLAGVIASRIVHYHSRTFLGPHSLLSILNRADYRVAEVTSRVVFHFHGGELRKPEELKKSRQYFSSPVIVATPDLLRFAPEHALFLPNPVDMERFRPNQIMGVESMRVGFYKPVTSYVRGFTDPEFVENTIANLEPRCVPVGADRIPWTRMPEFFNSVDVWVDKFEIGFYGMSACEAAACGIPVITQIDEALLPYVGDCPFVNVTKAGLSRALEYLLDENTRKYVGRRCLAYAGRYHDASKIAARLRSFYLA